IGASLDRPSKSLPNDLVGVNSIEDQKPIRILAMGQGQEKLALHALLQAQQQGQWLLLQNCHLLIPFLTSLEKELEAVQKPHSEFRLWMTTEPIRDFPIGLLQKSYKVVVEAPSTLKLILKSTFFNLTPNVFTESDHPAFPPLIFILAFFHSILLERRKYDKLGWNINYDFNESDFRVSFNIIKSYLNMSLERGTFEIPWITIRYLISEVIYGGRIIDSYDRRIIKTYMLEYFGDFVFDEYQLFHFYMNPSNLTYHDYFIPELRDFLSIKQQWLLQKANIHIDPAIEKNFEKYLPEKIAETLQRNMDKIDQVQISSLFHTRKQADSKYSLKRLFNTQKQQQINDAKYQFLSKNVLFNQFFNFALFRELYSTYVKQLPLYNPPNVLGLNLNAEINYYTKSARELWSLMLDLQPQTFEIDNNFNREEFVKTLCDDILQQIPSKKDLRIIKQKFNQRITPTINVLFQELTYFNLLTSQMWRSITELKRALKGEIGLSFELDEINRHIFNGLIPPLWRTYTPQTRKSLGNWMEHFRRRNQQYDKWYQDGELKLVWLGGLHVPESYLAAITQIAARKNQWPLDRSTFYTSVSKWQKYDDIDEVTQGICLIDGLYLEGAGWDIDNRCLVQQKSKQLIQLMPIIKVVPVESHRLNTANYLPTPVYATSDRCNSMGHGLIFEAGLYTREHYSQWILNGVCLLLNTD
ncbi:unnamed protein product, partial [Didymodactylos carnosus]